jgi:hypothetical protein
MTNEEKIELSLEKIREFLHGAHLATNDENAGCVMHAACHKIDDILVELKINNATQNQDISKQPPLKEWRVI